MSRRTWHALVRRRARLLAVVAVLMIVGGPRPVMGQDDGMILGSEAHKLEIGPIPGLTTTWHPAPEWTFIPRGSVVWLRQTAPAEAVVTWSGALEVLRDASSSLAVCRMAINGPADVFVEVVVDGELLVESAASFEIVDIRPESISVSDLRASVVPVDLDESATNAETMTYYFGESIATMEHRRDGSYLTSVDRTIRLEARVEPAGFAPLVEWRIDGAPVLLGADRAAWSFDAPGRHHVEAGPRRGDPPSIEVETYGVRIVDWPADTDDIPNGAPVTFHAETDPPGYEDRIRWLSSTKFGSASPVLGEGPVFTCTFTDTWGVDENNDIFQWLGVRGDSALVNQDGKIDTDCKIFPIKKVEVEGVNIEGRYSDPVNGNSIYSFDGVATISVIGAGVNNMTIVGFQAQGQFVSGFNRGPVFINALANGSATVNILTFLIANDLTQPVQYQDGVEAFQGKIELDEGYFECSELEGPEWELTMRLRLPQVAIGPDPEWVLRTKFTLPGSSAAGGGGE